MCCIAEIAMLVFGIIALVKGKFSLTGSRVVRAVPARIIGVILLLPLVIGQGVSLAVITIQVSKLAAQGKQMSYEEGWQEGMRLSGPLTLVNGIITGVCLFAALGIAIGTAKPPKSKRRRIREEEYDDYEDTRPRRRRIEEDDDDDEPRYRRRRIDQDSDDEDPPRRRRRTEDDG
jgi:hypothetical protein